MSNLLHTLFFSCIPKIPIKKSIALLFLALFFSCKLLAQELPLTHLPASLIAHPEHRIKLNLFSYFEKSNYNQCYACVFAVRFELDKKTGVVKNLKFSDNIVDTAIINIVRKAIIDTQSIWNLKNCKKANPSLRFLQPIYIFISKNGCYNTYNNAFLVDSVGKHISSLVNLPEKGWNKDVPLYNGEFLTVLSTIKFTGMMLNPIIVGVNRHTRPDDFVIKK